MRSLEQPHVVEIQLYVISVSQGMITTSAICLASKYSITDHFLNSPAPVTNPRVPSSIPGTDQLRP